MGPCIDTRWSLLSLRALILENASLRVVVLPELGGRIQSIIYKPADRELLWQNPRISPRRVPFGSAYDDVWCGGWEEIFPNDAPGAILGENYPDHGELWTLEWAWSAERRSEFACLTLSCTAPVSGLHIEKRLFLDGARPQLRVAYRLSNPNRAAFPFLWKLHPALAITPGCRIELPPKTEVEFEPAFPGTLDGAQPGVTWPCVRSGDRIVDLRQMLPESSAQVYFAYGTGYEEGWCAVTDGEARLSFGLVFAPEIFRSCWVFASLGGWRNYYVAVLEPSTSHPFRIEHAIQRQTARVLQPGEAVETSVRFQVQPGLSQVAGITETGDFKE